MKKRDYSLLLYVGTVLLVMLAVFVVKNSGILTAYKNDGLSLILDTELSFSQSNVSAQSSSNQADFDVSQQGETTVQSSENVTENAIGNSEFSQTSNQSQSQREEDELQNAIDIAMGAVNNKKHSENFKATKDQIIKLEVTDCSVPGVKALGNPIIEHFCKEKVIDFEFVNGVAYDSDKKKDVTVSYALPPEDRDFSIDKNGVASYSVENSENGTVYTFTLISESTTLENPCPQYHSLAMDYLDLSRVDISPATITKADFNYSGATITIEVDSNGNLIFFREYMPMCTSGAAKLGLEATGTIEGYIDESWTFQ